jgi:hypothetical protein
VTAAAGTTSRKIAEDGRLWVFVSTPVFAWIAAQQLDFILSPWVCATGHRWVLLVVTGLALLLAAAGGLATWKVWKRLPADDRDDPTVARRRFVAGGGLLLTAVFLTAIVALAIPILLHRPCD